MFNWAFRWEAFDLWVGLNWEVSKNNCLLHGCEGAWVRAQRWVALLGRWHLRRRGLLKGSVAGMIQGHQGKLGDCSSNLLHAKREIEDFLWVVEWRLISLEQDRVLSTLLLPSFSSDLSFFFVRTLFEACRCSREEWGCYRSVSVPESFYVRTVWWFLVWE